MKTLLIFLIALTCFSFCPSIEEPIAVTSNGFYISVKDHTDRTYHEYIVENKDSVKHIFRKYFESELALGEVDFPISIFNSEHDFYLARVYIYVKANGKKDFKHLNYPNVYHYKKQIKRKPLNEQIFELPDVKPVRTEN